MDTTFERLDKEHRGRIRELCKVIDDKRGFSVDDIFLSPAVVQSLDKPKIIIESFDIKRILTAFPFTPEIYVTLCPHCSCREDQRDLRTLLEHRAITPILVAPYSSYDAPVAKLVLQYPHMSIHEFKFYRLVELLRTAKTAVCQHCLAERKKEILKIADNAGLPNAARSLIGEVFFSLDPYRDPDYEILDHFSNALKAKDTNRLTQISAVASAVWDARTTEAYRARSILPAHYVPRLISEAEKTLPNIPENDLALLDAALMQDVHLEIPATVDVEHYIRTVEPFRDELSGISESLIVGSDNSKLSALTTSIGSLNQELAKMRRSKGLLLYRAATGFLQTNKTLLASGLLASVMGLSGNYLACGTTVLAGVGAKVARKMGKLKMPPAATGLVDEVKHSVRPYIHKLLAKYLDIDIRAVQLWDINEKLSRAIQKQTVSTKKPTRVARPRRSPKKE